ncbi:MAG: glutathione S-transferase N-terminal domain-containing protein [Marinobacter sp.]|uniref:glutathione S-transferase family protein n=1 Tax=Marinobacter sp. TaxID=50741 RepID=UPI00299E85A9|nr:glutathione S-transferase N-terminal domain-containing protein [Marinobacter sp.]MDX1634585.1 glutathione S-transferase N-terminal domain-containing protein [Marinobacter sp.]
MQLYLNQTSPYARVARIVAVEKGLLDRVELEWVDPWANREELIAVNPASRIPVLTTDDGEALSESLLIALYLDEQGASNRLVPAPERARVLALAGRGQALADAAFNTVIGRKHEGLKSDDTVLGQRRLVAMRRLLAELAHGVDRPVMEMPLNLGHIVLAVALDYLDFRLPELAWRDKHPALATWADPVLGRDSFTQTAFE